MFNNLIYSKYQFNLPDLMTTPFSYSSRSGGERKNFGFKLISRNLAPEDKGSKSSSVIHEPIEASTLQAGSKDSRKSYYDQTAMTQNYSHSYTHSPPRTSRLFSYQFYIPETRIKYLIHEVREDTGASLAQDPLIGDVEESNVVDANLDEGFFDLQPENNEIDAIQTQLETLTASHEYHLTQTTSRGARVRKIGTTVPWRRSADFIYEGRPVVRNKIRMRKARPLQHAM